MNVSPSQFFGGAATTPQPSGTQIQPTNPGSVSAQQFFSGSAQTTPQGAPSVGGFVSNAVGSVGNLVGGVGNAIMHPIQTVENLGGAALGVGEQASNTLLGTNFQDGNVQKAQGLENFYNQRYGIADLASGNIQGAAQKILTTLYKDPAGAAADLSILLDGGGAALKLGGATDAASLATKTGEALNPLNYVGKAAGVATDLANKGIASGIGLTSKLGYTGASDVINAARDGGTALDQMTNAARGGLDEEQFINDLQSSVGKMRAKQLADYKAGLAEVDKNYRETNLSSASNSGATIMQNNKVPDLNSPDLAAGPNAISGKANIPGELFPISTQGVKSVMTRTFADHNIVLDSEGKIDLSNSPISDSEGGRLQSIKDNISNWTDTTPLGIKNLTKKIGGYFKPLAKDDEVNSIIQGLKTNLNSYLRDKVPEFKAMDSAYRETSKLLNGERGSPTPNFKRDLSLSPKSMASADSILKKVTKAATTQDDFRSGLIKQLETTSGKDIRAITTGLQAQGWTPHGLIAGGFEIGTFIHPQLAIGLVMSSPRVAFEFLRGLGLAETKISDLMQGINAARATLITSRAGTVSNPADLRPASPSILVKAPKKFP